MDVIPAWALATALAVGALLVSAVAALVLGLRPRRRTIAEVRSILQPSSGPGMRATGTDHRRAASAPSADGSVAAEVGGRGSGSPGTRLVRLTDAVARPLGRAVDRHLGADGLRLVGRSAHEVATRIVVAALALGFTTLCLVAAFTTLGMVPASPWWLLAVLLAAALGASVMWSDTRAAVDRRRREFRRTVTDFVQLVAVGLTTDQSVEEAVQFALGIGDSDLFDLVRSELATAPLRGVPLWEAIDQLGRDFQQRELCEFAASIERQGTQGVSIVDTVNTLATAMRAKALDELERDADRANADLAGPTIGFVVATVVFLAFPLAVRIGEAFGG